MIRTKIRKKQGSTTDFKKNLLELMGTKNETIYYPNGRIWYVGEVLHVKENDSVVDRIANGNGTWYYDGLSSRIKYQGEWENGKFDGAGIFYSYDGKMSISANNISGGIPTQKKPGKIEWMAQLYLFENILKSKRSHCR